MNLDAGLLLATKLTQWTFLAGPLKLPVALAAAHSQRPRSSAVRPPGFPSVASFALRLPFLRGQQLAVGSLGGSSLEEVAGGSKP